MAGLLLGFLQACGAETSTAPRTAADVDRYPGQCHLVGIEAVERPATAYADTLYEDVDTIELVAQYEFGVDGQGDVEGRPGGVRFLVTEKQAQALRSHLNEHPVVLCGPEAGPPGVPAAPAEIEVPPFRGQEGEPLPPEQAIEPPVEVGPPASKSEAP